MKNKISYLLLLIVLFSGSLNALSEKSKTGIDEKLGNFIPLDTEFTNSEGQIVKLSELITKPTLLALVYYECPGICSPLQTELGWVASKVELKPSEDFQVVSLSFDSRETPEIAAKWKRNYIQGIKRGFPENAWTFLTGDSVSIKKITDAVGFNYIPSPDSNFIHAGAIITISPKGKISRYIYGLQYNPFDIKMALIDAEAGKTSPTITKILQYCFSYDPEGRGYTLNITRIIGTLMLLGVGSFLLVLLLKKKKVNKEQI
ncbi:MAG: SCO family protein [Bacteroidetes bacterium]|nr:SCO family protein [Bacteroidota bacterium]